MADFTLLNGPQMRAFLDAPWEGPSTFTIYRPTAWTKKVHSIRDWPDGGTVYQWRKPDEIVSVSAKRGRASKRFTVAQWKTRLAGRGAASMLRKTFKHAAFVVSPGKVAPSAFPENVVYNYGDAYISF